MRKIITLQAGEIYAIPLFASDILSNKSFAKQNFNNKGKEFAYCRIIENRHGSGYIAEIFDLVGGLDESVHSVINAKRLFSPLAISGMGVTTKRWRLVGVQEDYDKELHSNYSEIQLVLGVEDDYSLWQNGQEKDISNTEAQKYELWKVWTPQQLEKRIIKALFEE